MNTVKRIEIVIEAAHIPVLLDALHKADAPGYTLIRDIQGMGDRGLRRADGLTDVFRNSYLIVACPPDKADVIIDAVRPLLAKNGGVCLVQDAEWIRH